MVQACKADNYRLPAKVPEAREDTIKMDRHVKEDLDQRGTDVPQVVEYAKVRKRWRNCVRQNQCWQPTGEDGRVKEDIDCSCVFP